MTTLTYCKGLPTPSSELNPIGFTKLEMLLSAMSEVYHQGTSETVNHLLTHRAERFDKSKWNTHLQTKYQINKRQANGIIVLAVGKVDSAKECRRNHIKQLEAKLKSAKEWVKKAKKKLKLGEKFYAKSDWIHSKGGCNFPLSSSVEWRSTNWQGEWFKIHNKQRYISTLIARIKHLKTAVIRVKVPRSEVFIVGSKDESYGNQSCQWDGKTLTMRVPYCLEESFGKTVSLTIGGFDRNINRLPEHGAKTWHFYRQDGRWVVAVQFTPATVTKISRPIQFGCIGIDMNPSSVGWAYIDFQGNLKESGTIPLQTGLPTGKQDANIVDACLQLAILAATFACPIVCESLDFAAKKTQLRERGRKYARMLSGWAYSRFYQLLESILSNRGISLLTCNPAYTSLIGLVKYSRMYGLSSDIAAAMAIARRGMNLSERLPRSVSAYLQVNCRKHVWSGLNQLNKFIGQCVVVNRRHDYYHISNWADLVMADVERVASNSNSRASSKRSGARSSGSPKV
jgi:IS605 OrfB family transposase